MTKARIDRRKKATMNNFENIVKELLQTKDELTLKVHLMEMDAKTKWQDLCERFAKIEDELELDLLSFAKKVGDNNEQVYVGSETEIKQLLEDFQDLKEKAMSDN